MESKRETWHGPQCEACGNYFYQGHRALCFWMHSTGSIHHCIAGEHSVEYDPFRRMDYWTREIMGEWVTVNPGLPTESKVHVLY